MEWGLKARLLTRNWKLSEHSKTLSCLDITALPVFFMCGI